jgi:flagellar L-ring protein precursor FlgH
MRSREPVELPESWTRIPKPGVRQLQLNDRIMVRVDELSRVQSEGEFEGRKDLQYDAVLRDWIQLIGLKAIKPSPQADGDQRIAGDLKQLFRAEGDMAIRESLALNITCTVADIRPNGDVVLEGHKEIQINNESWAVSLSGICRYLDIGPDNTVLSRKIADLKIVKRDRGHVRDSYKRGWLSRWIDEFSPF